MTGIEMLRNLAKHCRDASINGWTTVVTSVHAAAIEATANQLEREMQPKRDPAEDVSTSAYDLLPQEDRDAIAWVREHGGLDEVEAHWSGRVPLTSVKRMVALHKSKRERLKAHALLLERKCHERRERICELNKLKRAYIDALNGVCKRLGLTDGTGLPDMPEVIWAELDRRLMPEGMEWLLEVWPKWSNGEYCKFGDWWTADKYGDYEPKQLRRLVFYTPEQLREWEQDEGDNFGYEWDFMRPSDTTYRPDKVEPPAPKVLDADGVEIRVGDRVWSTHLDEPHEWIVIDPHEDRDDSQTVLVSIGDRTGHARPENLTHRAPVLAADGMPLRERETVWDIETCEELHVTGFNDGYVITDSKTFGDTPITPSVLTHERPDSWERLEEDAKKLTCEYFGHSADDGSCEECHAYTSSTPQGGRGCRYAQMADLVRRAKALAERGE